MSSDSRDDGRGAPSYPVGYRRPPSHSQFKKGVSGNPNGRPKGAKNKQPPLDPFDQPTRDILLNEFYRPMKIRDGNKEIELPAIQVAARALALAAAKGKPHAQRTVLTMAAELERQAAELNDRAIKSAEEYKRHWTARSAEWKDGAGPEPLPHPDDIYIDRERNRVEVRGPTTAKEKAALDECLAMRQRYETGFHGLVAEATHKPEDADLPLLAKGAQDRFDLYNNVVPERCRKELTGRISDRQYEVAVQRFQQREASKKKQSKPRLSR